MNREEELDFREGMIEYIEGKIGTLDNIHLLSTKDLNRLCDYINWVGSE